MFQCISVHYTARKYNCPNCYLQQRDPSARQTITAVKMRRLLDTAYSFGIKEVALGINDSSDFHYIKEVARLLNSSMTRRLTVSFPTEVLADELSYEYNSNSWINAHIDELFISIDTTRYSKLNSLTEDLILIRCMLDQPKLGLAILMTSAQSLRLSMLLSTIECKFPGLFEYYLIAVRNVQLSEQDKENISHGFSQASDMINELGIHDRITFDHCNIMSMNGQKCGGHGLLDLDTSGNIRTCVYSRASTLTLSPDNAINEFESFLESVKDNLTPEIECNKCPVLWQCEPKSGVTNGTNNKENISVRENEAVVKETA